MAAGIRRRKRGHGLHPRCPGLRCLDGSLGKKESPLSGRHPAGTLSRRDDPADNDAGLFHLSNCGRDGCGTDFHRLAHVHRRGGAGSPARPVGLGSPTGHRGRFAGLSYCLLAPLLQRILAMDVRFRAGSDSGSSDRPQLDAGKPKMARSKATEGGSAPVFARIGGSPHADLEMGRIEHLPVRKTGSFADLFQPGIRKALLVACALAVLLQFSGTGPLLLHAPVAFRRAGLETVASDALLQSIVVTSWKLLWTVAGLWAIDRFGRRPLLLTGTSAMALGLALASVFFTDPGGPALLLTMLLVVAGVVVSLAPLAWVMMSEVFPTHLRGKGMTLASLSLWVSAFSGPFLLPAMLSFFKESLGSEAWGFGIFVAVCLFAVAFGWRLVPETKGRSLEEIGESW